MLREAVIESRIDLREVYSNIINVLLKSNNLIDHTDIQFASVSHKIREGWGVNRERDAQNFVKTIWQSAPELTLDIFNIALQSILRERKLEGTCTYELDCNNKIIEGITLLNRSGRIVKEPVFSKDELCAKVIEIREIMSLLYDVEKHQEDIGNCITEIVDVIKSTFKQPPHQLVQNIKTITEQYVSKQNLTHEEIENAYIKASELSKAVIKETKSGQNILIKLLDSIKELVCSIFGKSASQKVDKIFSELKQDITKEKQPIQQQSGKGI